MVESAAASDDVVAVCVSAESLGMVTTFPEPPRNLPSKRGLLGASVLGVVGVVEQATRRTLADRMSTLRIGVAPSGDGGGTCAKRTQ